MNCVSLAIMGVGGTLWAFDISGLREAQSILRSRLNYDVIYQPDEPVPESIGGLLKASKETTKPEDDKNSTCEAPR